MSDLRQQTLRDWQQDKPPFPHYLPHVTCRAETVVLTDRLGQAPSVGGLWELEPVCVEGAADERWDSVSSAMDGLLARLPEDTAVQFYLIGDPHIGDDIAQFVNRAQRDDVIGTICADRVRLYQQSVHTPLFEHKGIPFRCRRVRVYVSVRHWPQRVGWFNRIGHGHIAIDAWLSQAQAEFSAIEQILREGLQLTGMGLTRLDPHALKALLWRLLNPGEPFTATPYREDTLLRHQLLGHHPEADGHGLTCGTHCVTILSASEPPTETSPGLFVRERDFGGAIAALLDLFPELCLVYNVHILNQQQAYAHVKRRKSLAWINRLDPLQGFSVESDVVGRDLEHVLAEVFGRGRRVLAVGMHALLSGTATEVTAQRTRVLAALDHLGMRFVPEEHIGAPLVVQCLPLGFDPAADTQLCRLHRYVSANVADLLPVYGYFRGVGNRTGRFLWLSRRGELVFFDPSTAAPSPNMLVSGITRSGKTLFVMDLAVQGLRLGARVVVLDKGKSYQRFCTLLGGRHVPMDARQLPRLNPFVGALTPERLPVLWREVAEMMQGRSERDFLTREQEGMIERAISDTYHRFGQDEVTLSDIAAQLQAQGTYGTQLAFRLQPWLRSGRYGRYVDGPNELTLDNVLTVFELGQLDSDPDLQRILTMVLVDRITTTFAQASEALRFLVAEELSSVLYTDNAGRYLEEVARTYGKIGTSLVSVTQQPMDLAHTRAGQAIRDNSPIRFLLPQPPEVVEAVSRELALTPEKTALFHSLETVPGKFSEALLDTPTGTGVIRIVLPPSQYWLTTSNDAERRYLDRQCQRLGSLEAAILDAAARYPHGLTGMLPDNDVPSVAKESGTRAVDTHGAHAGVLQGGAG
jgi:conjugal transfer ATP-binding protein TraC